MCFGMQYAYLKELKLNCTQLEEFNDINER
jgi:hypothetical protein